jgi:hypothetical protein
VRVADLAGGEQLELYQTLALLNANASDALSQGRVILVAPAYSPGIAELACSAERSAAAVATLKRSICIDPLWPQRPSFGLHVDMDRLDQLVRGGVGRSGVGVWVVKPEFSEEAVHLETDTG